MQPVEIEHDRQVFPFGILARTELLTNVQELGEQTLAEQTWETSVNNSGV